MNNKTQIISLITTSVCQLRCKNCFVIPWMNLVPNWHWTLEGVMRFIAATKASKYHFKKILLSGGDPLLWENLVPGLKLLKKSGITDKIKLLTNSIAVNEKNIEWFTGVVDLVDIIRISRYVGNENSIEIIQRYFKGSSKIVISDKTVFAILPKKPVKNAVPADCACDYPTVLGNTVYSCGGAKFLSLFHGFTSKDNPMTPIKKGYLSVIETKKAIKDKKNQKACSYCRANRKVNKKLITEPNYCLKGGNCE